MAWDKSEDDYHLTPRGWEYGEPPDDRVETWHSSMYQASGWSKEHIRWTCTWVNQDIPRAERDALRRNIANSWARRAGLATESPPSATLYRRSHA